jgi:hypothetical protein
MISIITASRDARLLKNLEDNIAETIGGIPYEFILCNSVDAKKGLSFMYNEASIRACNDIICFCHEDISFHTKHWGQKLLDIFNNNPEMGLIGVAGSKYKALTPSTWFNEGFAKFKRVNIIQHSRFNDKSLVIFNPDNKRIEDVATLDGVFLATRKEIISEIKFDSENFRNFHFYDLDFSLQVLKKYKVCVQYDFLIEHFSVGKIDRTWIYDGIQFYRKWRKSLPVRIQYDICLMDALLIEYRKLIVFIKFGIARRANIFKVLTTVVSVMFVLVKKLLSGELRRNIR